MSAKWEAEDSAERSPEGASPAPVPGASAPSGACLGEPVIYEIVNPSDYYTIKSASPALVAVSVLLLGDGKYAATPLSDGGTKTPLFFFGGAGKWFAETFGADLDDFFGTHRSEIAECLDSVVIGNRDDFEAGVAGRVGDDRTQFCDAWLNRHRSSMNDIGGRAARYAERLRQIAAKASP